MMAMCAINRDYDLSPYFSFFQAITMEKPTMWPHLPEDQPGYVAKEGAEQ